MPPPAAAVNKALQLLNWMISQWNRKRWIVYRLEEYSLMSTGQQSYTVGPGGDFNVSPRPNSLEYAFMRQVVNVTPNNPVDYPLVVLSSREDYSRVTLKKLLSWPEAVWYDPAYPVGMLYTAPVMQAGYFLHFGTKQVLSRYDDLNALLGLPEEYDMALYYNMVIRLGASYRIQQDPTMVALAKDSLNILRQANNAISTLQMPSALRRTDNNYDIYSDNN